MSIEWVAKEVRVPENRRSVLAWGVVSYMGYVPFGHQFLGQTRFNPCCEGGQFDIENCSRFSHKRVTHWAEITGPQPRGKENAA